MGKYIIGAILVVLAAGSGYYAWVSLQNTPQEQENALTPQTQSATSTYATTSFSIVYPLNFTVNELYKYEGVPNKPIDGLSFTVPVIMATGTNLSSDSRISVEWLPRAQSCTGDIYILDNVKATKISENNVQYSLATTTGAGAGNVYEEQVYALASSSPCTAVRYFIHSTNISNYDPGTVREFDRDALLRAFDTIRRSLKLNSPGVEIEAL